MKTQKINNKMQFIIIIFSCLFVIALFSNVSFAQDEIIKVDTDLITVPITVLDRDGRYLTKLRREDFKIFENGIEQEIRYFEPIEKPFTVLLLLDNSGSMNDYLPSLGLAANAFLKQLKPEDKLIVATFAGSRKIEIRLEATEVKNLRGQIKLTRQINDGFTATFDAVEEGIKYMKNFQGRRAIVLFSDGEQYGQKASAKSNLRDAEEQEAIIYTLRFGDLPPLTPEQLCFALSLNHEKRKLKEKVDEYMQGLAQKTGGRSYDIDNIGDLETTFAQVANELGQQYSIGYYPKETGKKGERRQIKVKVNVPNAAVRARESYIVGANK